MPRGKSKVTKVDLYLSQLAEQVLTNFFEGNKVSKVAIPDYFTIADVNETAKNAKTFKHMVYTKEEGVKNIVTASVTVKYLDETCYLIITSK